MGLFKNEEAENQFNVGDKVRVKDREQEGFITGKDGDLYTVLINNGAIIDKYEASELEKCW